MEHLLVDLNNLPDEILMIIFQKLCNVEILYSFIGVNKRFNTIACDLIFTDHLTLLQTSSDNSVCSLPDLILDKFCSQILPEIHNKIKWFSLESTSMECILLATNYPNLSRLSLYGIDVEEAMSLFIDKTALLHVFQNQITSLVISLIRKTQTSLNNSHALLFTQIFTIFTNLQSLNFNSSSIGNKRLCFHMLSPTAISSTLLELHVSVIGFSDCLYLLDGRFKQLRALHVDISVISVSSLTINNKEKLPNLRIFSLYCDTCTNDYDKVIVLLLNRMLNLEKLDLHLVVDRYKLIDGNDLKKDVITHMSLLNKFEFNICSRNYLDNQINLPSNKDIQQTFEYLHNNYIISCVDYFQEKRCSQCHIYSYPYKVKFYKDISNNFPGGLFKHVDEVSLYDERPFEHEFFLRIAQSFPFMEDLMITNRKAQKNKQWIKSKNDNQNLTIIEYPHLTTLYFHNVHDDYVEQFLIDAKMCLPNNVKLFVDYESLERVTHNFTRNATRINCAKLSHLHLHRNFQIPKHAKDYFPHINRL